MYKALCIKFFDRISSVFISIYRVYSRIKLFSPFDQDPSQAMLNIDKRIVIIIRESVFRELLKSKLSYWTFSYWVPKCIARKSVQFFLLLRAKSLDEMRETFLSLFAGIAKSSVALRVHCIGFRFPSESTRPASTFFIRA